MQPTRISLARIRELQLSISWQEAVAVACAAGDVSLATGSRATMDTCHVTTAGVVEIVGGHGQSGGLRTPIFSLLAALLEGESTPEELRAFVAAQQPESDDVLLDFPSEDDTASGQPLHDLAFFARPNPEQVIAALAARGIAAAADDEARHAIERLREETIAPIASVNRLRRLWALPAIPIRLRQAAAVAASIIVAALLLTVAWFVLSRSTAGTTMQAADAAPAPSLTSSDPAPGVASPPSVTSHPSVASPRIMTSPAPPPVPDRATAALPEIQATKADPPAARVEQRRRRQPAPSPIRELPSSRPVALTAALPAIVPEPIGIPEAPEPTPIEPPASDAPVPAPLPRPPAEDRAAEIAGDRMYSVEDSDVVPPVMIRPQMPSEPRSDSEPSYAQIELVINAEGVVTQVRLRSTGELSLNDRMLVAAAKAWQFRPAFRNGRPVAYMLRIPVTP